MSYTVPEVCFEDTRAYRGVRPAEGPAEVQSDGGTGHLAVRLRELLRPDPAGMASAGVQAGSWTMLGRARCLVVV